MQSVDCCGLTVMKSTQVNLLWGKKGAGMYKTKNNIKA